MDNIDALLKTKLRFQHRNVSTFVHRLTTTLQHRRHIITVVDHKPSVIRFTKYMSWSNLEVFLISPSVIDNKHNKISTSLVLSISSVSPLTITTLSLLPVKLQVWYKNMEFDIKRDHNWKSSCSHQREQKKNQHFLGNKIFYSESNGVNPTHSDSLVVNYFCHRRVSLPKRDKYHLIKIKEYVQQKVSGWNL